MVSDRTVASHAIELDMLLGGSGCLDTHQGCQELICNTLSGVGVVQTTPKSFIPKSVTELLKLLHFPADVADCSELLKTKR